MARTQTYSPQTLDASRLLGLEIARARRSRRWSMAELGDRAGVSHITIRKVEQGDLGVAVGTVFETAAILGIDLFAPAEELPGLVARSRERLALLPSRVRDGIRDVDDDF